MQLPLSASQSLEMAFILFIQSTIPLIGAKISSAAFPFLEGNAKTELDALIKSIAFVPPLAMSFLAAMLFLVQFIANTYIIYYKITDVGGYSPVEIGVGAVPFLISMGVLVTTVRILSGRIAPQQQ